MKIVDLKVWQMQEKLKAGEISSREITKAHLEQIDKLDDNINAFISYDKEAALKEADKIDEKISKGEELPALAGLPIGIKDNIITKDFKTTAGSKMLENFQPPYDATVVERIKESKGIIIGKTNMDEFAMGGTTQSSYFGPTKNPLDEKKIPGGSSGGSAAAVAAGEVALALGTDTGGSIRLPASYCGLVGLKPSYGYVSRFGLIPLANSLDQIGVLAKDVKDAVLLLNTISGHDERDATSTELDTYINIDSFDPIEDIKGMKIGLPKEYFQLDMDPKVKDEIRKAIQKFETAGAIVEEVSLPHIKYTSEVYNIIVSAEASSNMGRYDGIRYGFRAEDYDDLDQLFVRSRSEAFGKEVKKRILLGTYLLSEEAREKYYKKAQKIRTLLINDFNQVFSQYDLILTPTSPRLARPVEGSKDTYKNYIEAVNLAGLCAISVPTSNDGIEPVGLQIIGDRFNEEKIIKAALAYEGMVE